MTAPLNIAQAADLVDLSIQKIFPKTSEPESMYPKYYNVRTTEDYYEKDSSLSGLGESDFVDENAAIVSDVPIQGLKLSCPCKIRRYAGNSQEAKSARISTNG